MNEWTEAKNERRCELIELEAVGTLSPAERSDLASLQEQMLEHRRRVAPLPIAEATALHAKLRQAQGPGSGAAAIMGRWPGDETDEEIAEALLNERTVAPTPKAPIQSKLFATGCAILLLGIFECSCDIGAGHDYPRAANILTVLGGALTIIFRRYTDRPFRFTQRGQHDGGSKWQP